jgi:hypothetical protein
MADHNLAFRMISRIFCSLFVCALYAKTTRQQFIFPNFELLIADAPGNCDI